MSKYNKGDTVRLVRVADKFMQAERRNIGKVGEVVEIVRDGSLTYFEVRLDNGVVASAEAQGLSIVRRDARVSNKRELDHA